MNAFAALFRQLDGTGSISAKLEAFYFVFGHALCSKKKQWNFSVYFTNVFC